MSTSTFTKGDYQIPQVYGKHLSAQSMSVSANSRLSVMLVGAPGTAKTAEVRAFAKAIGYTVLTIIGSRMDPQDVSGFPTRGEITDEDGVTRPITEYAPQWWQRYILEHKKCILLLDEWSNAQPSVQASFLSILQDREFPNGDKFPQETIIIGAMNPMDSAVDGFELALPTTNRMKWVSWKPDTESWLEGMPTNWDQGVENPFEHAWRSRIVRFIRENPAMLHKEPSGGRSSADAYGLDVNNASDMALTQYPWPSRRSWDKLSTELGNIPKGHINLEDLSMMGWVGPEAATRFRDWLRNNGELDVAGILRDPSKFEDWADLSMDDTNMLLRAAVENLTQGSDKPLVRAMAIPAILEAYDAVGHHSDVTAYLTAMMKAGSVVGLTKQESAEVKRRTTAVLRKFNGYTW